MRYVSVLTLCTLFFLLGCSNPIADRDQQVDIVIDITESVTQRLLDAEQVSRDALKVASIDSDYAGSLEINVYVADDISGGRASDVRLDEDKKGNSMLRKEAIESFKEKLRDIASEAIGVKGEKNSSKIYSKFCNILRKQGSKERKVLLYSDLLENSELATFYKPGIIKRAADQPIQFAEQHFNKFCELGDLKNLEIHIFPLRTPENDALVNHAEKFWRELLESKGAEVHINTL